MVQLSIQILFREQFRLICKKHDDKIRNIKLKLYDTIGGVNEK